VALGQSLPLRLPHLPVRDPGVQQLPFDALDHVRSRAEREHRRPEVAMTDSAWTGPLFETFIDRQIREATERGAFKDLPGAGKPIPDLDGPHDELWWVKQLARREKVSLLPPALALRREVEDVHLTVAQERSERAVRRVVAALNERIAAERRALMQTGAAPLRPLDVADILREWHEQR